MPVNTKAGEDLTGDHQFGDAWLASDDGDAWIMSDDPGDDQAADEEPAEDVTQHAPIEPPELSQQSTELVSNPTEAEDDKATQYIPPQTLKAPVRVSSGTPTESPQTPTALAKVSTETAAKAPETPKAPTNVSTGVAVDALAEALPHTSDGVDHSDAWLASDEPVQDTSNARAAQAPLSAFDDVDELDAWMTPGGPPQQPQKADDRHLASADVPTDLVQNVKDESLHAAPEDSGSLTATPVDNSAPMDKSREEEVIEEELEPSSSAAGVPVSSVDSPQQEISADADESSVTAAAEATVHMDQSPDMEPSADDGAPPVATMDALKHVAQSIDQDTSETPVGRSDNSADGHQHTEASLQECSSEQVEPSDAWLHSDSPADGVKQESEYHGTDFNDTNALGISVSAPDVPIDAPADIPAGASSSTSPPAQDALPNQIVNRLDKADTAPMLKTTTEAATDDYETPDAGLTSQTAAGIYQDEQTLDAQQGSTNDLEASEAWFTSDPAQEDLQRSKEETDLEDAEPSDAWLTSDAPAEVSQQPEFENSFDTREPTKEDGNVEIEKNVSQSHFQHSSSMSFARTVSHEINFQDDDEGDWNLSRTDTDPFKFMPPSDRTNSFPAVPPVKQQEEQNQDQPLPSAQALDVLEEADKGETDDIDAQTAEPQEPRMFWDEEGQPSRMSHASSQSIGGTVGDATTEASQARYEEGLPLIPRNTVEETQRPGGKTDASTDFGSSFVDDDGDDFFSQIPQSNKEGESIYPVERKPTMHFLQPAASEQAQDGSEEQLVKSGARDVPNNEPERVEDLASKWQEAFGGADDDDFLLDEQEGAEQQPAEQDVDTGGFLGSDDEGLLEDDDEAPTASSVPQSSTLAGAGLTANRYAPSNLPSAQPTPAQTATPQVASYGYSSAPTTFPPTASYAPNTRPQPAVQRAESFADKAKGGYSSPYDLPTDLISMNVKPRKRPSMQQLGQEQTSTQPPPPRSTSGYTPSQTPSAPPSAPPMAGLGQQRPAPKTSSRSDSSFFEDLPVTTKPRPSSRQSARAPSPAKQYCPVSSSPSFTGPPQNTHMQPDSRPNTDSHNVRSPESASVDSLVTPPKANPYAAVQSSTHAVPPPSGTASRYSPAPAQQPKSGSAPPPAATSRFSPAPLSRQNSSQSPPAHASASQTYLPHLPRTSSPLAHFEIHNAKSSNAVQDTTHLDRRASSAYDPKLNRVSSLPPTTEVDEEDYEHTANHQLPPQAANASRYSPTVGRAGKTPPPSAAAYQTSPQKRSSSNYLPQITSADNATSNVSPTKGQTYASAGRQRGPSLSMNLVPPTDGREHDPLKRWQGTPILSWGVGGTMVTSFPKSIPRYSMNQTTPTMLRASGEVKVKSIKDVEPLQEHLAKFPGPLRGKSKKKDALAWLAAGIDGLEKELPDISMSQHLSLEAKRAIERVLLWKLLRVFVEFDGRLEGAPAVDKAVHDILAPKDFGSASSGDDMLRPNQSFGATQSTPTAMQADSVDSASMEQLRRDLLKGNREAAVWTAVDKRLWGHAMLISQTISPDLYKRVAQEFVRKEVNYPGHSNESLGAFYKVLSGNFDDCVDELVPVHARAGMQLMSTEVPAGSGRDAMEGLDKWRETVSLVLSNRSKDDIQGLHALGKLLSSYGRAEAAQICFIFSRAVSVFGGFDDPNADFVLLGADHHKQSDQFAKETEALQLSEIYEYGLTLSGAPSYAAGAPHLAAYKLQHAIVLAEYGHRGKALQYCDAIITAITAQTRRSPYHHSILEGAVDDFMRRLKQAPKEESSGWMSKPSMNKVSDSMWNRFNKFVSGDEDKDGGHGEGEQGPFARVASTPNISRSPSVSNFESYGGASPNYTGSNAPQPMPTAASARYAPSVTPGTVSHNPNEYGAQHSYATQPASTGRSSNEYTPNSYAPNYATNNMPSGYPGPSSYEPVQRAASAGYGRTASPYQPQAGAGYQPQSLQPSPSIVSAPTGEEANVYPGLQPSTYDAPEPIPADSSAGNDRTREGVEGGYVPPSLQSDSNEPSANEHSTSYEAPETQSFGYMPPSYEPGPYTTPKDDDEPKPKKKGIMDDDEDDIPALKPASKSQAELDRENEEMFRKAAEEDEKRAAEQQQAKKGWGFTSWFGGKKPDIPTSGSTPDLNKPTRAKLGEANSFVYDPELKRWINKKAGAEQVEAAKPPPPPPKSSTPRSVSGTPLPGAGPPGGPPRSVSTSNVPLSDGAPPSSSVPPPMARSVSNISNGAAPTPPSGPPSRPTTSMSNASSIDDLLGAPGPRKGGKAGQKKPRKSGRYVDVMAK